MSCNAKSEKGELIMGDEVARGEEACPKCRQICTWVNIKSGPPGQEWITTRWLCKNPECGKTTFNHKTGKENFFPNTPAKSGFCFIATAVYGSYNAPEVLALRNFRDDILLSSNVGRIWVNLYYIFSPPVARLLRAHLALRNMVRKVVVQPIVNLVRSHTTERRGE